MARIMGFDEVLKYAFGVANRLMHDGIKEALKPNPMYDAVDVGPISANEVTIGPVELAKLHKEKRKVRDTLVQSYLTKKQRQPYTSPVSASYCTSICLAEIADSVSSYQKKRGS